LGLVLRVVDLVRRFIGLVTDYGEGHYAGVLRAVIKGLAPDVEVVDLEHSVPSYNVLAGAYVIAVTYRWLPRGSIIVGVVDPGVGGPRRPIAVEAGDYFFVGPDNGLLYPAIESEGFRRGVELRFDKVARLVSGRFPGKLHSWSLSYTFHGRDLFAPAAALLDSVDLEDLGEPISEGDLVKLSIHSVEGGDGVYDVKVIYIDKFGNVVLSCKPGDLNLGDAVEVELQTERGLFRAPIGVTFSSVPQGELVVYENSFGYVEVAVNQGNAGELLGVRIGDRVRLRVRY
jgi:S-adenosylmethionine hydrolase